MCVCGWGEVLKEDKKYLNKICFYGIFSTSASHT